MGKFLRARSMLGFVLIVLLATGMWPTGVGASLRLAVLAHSAPLACATPVFVNEFHYDNSGTDTGEFIEVVGPAGTDLTGWTLVLYNGNGGAVYDTRALSGVIPNEGGSGYGTICEDWPTDGLQNGAPDGFALVNDSNVVQQFLSYEGTFTAVGGAANGMTSTNVGVVEGSSTQVGYSLQLKGTGMCPQDFTWTSPTPESKCGINAGQVFAGGVDVAPAVDNTTPADGATQVAVNTNITINFTEPVDVSGTWFNIVCSGSEAHTAAYSGGPTSFSLDPATDLGNCEQCSVTVLASQVTDRDGVPHNMAADYLFDFTTACGCNTIPQVQGLGMSSSPCLGDANALTGCVTGVTQDGFYMQASDGQTASSDGIYVYMYSGWESLHGIEVGYLASTSGGEIQEYYGATELYHPNEPTKGVACTLPTPVSVAQTQTLGPHDAIRYETTEFMRVQMTIDGHVQGPTARYDSIFVHGDPEIGFVYWDAVAALPHTPRLFQEDYAGYGGLNYLSGACNKDLPDVDFGDRIQAANLVGVMGYHFDKWQLVLDESQVQNIQVTNSPDVSDSELPFAADEFGLCTFNVENMFDSMDDGDGDTGDWSPANEAEYTRMVLKRARGIAQDLQGCTVIGLQEMEGKEQVWSDLAAQVSALSGINFGWDYYESQDPRDIAQGILYDADRVTLVSSSQRQGCTAINYGVSYTNAKPPRVVANPCSGAYPLFTRPPYVAWLRVEDGPEFTIIVNHFKSKGGNMGCATSDCTDWREKQAQFMQTLVDDYWAMTQNQAIVGDLNDYIGSAPITILDNTTTSDSQPLVNVITAHVPKADQYTFIYSGESEVLDYIYLSKVFDAYLKAASPMHIGADFPDVRPMDSDNCPGGNCPFGMRPEDDTSRHASDHDPVFVRMGIGPLAVKLLSFAGRPASSGILLVWETATEEDNAGFHLYRSTRIDAVGVRLNAALIPSRAPGGGQGAAYTFLDATAEPGTTYYYTLEDVDLNGTRTPHGPVAAAVWRTYLPLVGRW